MQELKRLNMRYKNTKTGAIFDSPCVISGGNWKEITENVDYGKMKNSELKAELDKLGIEYRAKDTRDELLALLTKGE